MPAEAGRPNGCVTAASICTPTSPANLSAVKSVTPPVVLPMAANLWGCRPRVLGPHRLPRALPHRSRSNVSRDARRVQGRRGIPRSPQSREVPAAADRCRPQRLSDRLRRPQPGVRLSAATHACATGRPPRHPGQHPANRVALPSPHRPAGAEAWGAVSPCGERDAAGLPPAGCSQAVVLHKFPQSGLEVDQKPGAYKIITEHIITHYTLHNGHTRAVCAYFLFCPAGIRGVGQGNFRAPHDTVPLYRTPPATHPPPVVEEVRRGKVGGGFTFYTVNASGGTNYVVWFYTHCVAVFVLDLSPAARVSATSHHTGLLLSRHIQVKAVRGFEF